VLLASVRNAGIDIVPFMIGMQANNYIPHTAHTDGVLIFDFFSFSINLQVRALFANGTRV
jgi:hypothetical protein